MKRSIIHVDMDAFYASIETRDHPEYQGKPVIVGALPHMRGVVAACNYEARAFGVRSSMNIKEAYRLCPKAIYLRPRIDDYATVSRALRQIWCSYSERVEFVAFDEAYIDISSRSMTLNKAMAIAREIQDRIVQEEQLPASVGVAYSMASAKMASEEKKPRGLFCIPDEDTWRRLVYPRPVSVIHGIGAASQDKLNKLGIYTVYDLVSNATLIQKQWGQSGHKILELAHGHDPRELTPYTENLAKSMGLERTFQEDSNDPQFLKSLLRLYAKELASKLEQSGQYAQTVSVKVTFSDMKSMSRSITVPPSRDAERLYGIACDLLDKIESRPLRLIGLSVSHFTDSRWEQLSFSDLEPARQTAQNKEKIIHQTIRSLEERFGDAIVQTGAELEAEQVVQTKRDRTSSGNM